MRGEQLLQVRLDAVLHQTGVDAELVAGVVQDLVEGDTSYSSALLRTVHTPGRSSSQHGGLIQLSGL